MNTATTNSAQPTTAPHEAIANNRRVLLQARPNGVPKLDDFRLEVCEAPIPGPDEVLLRTLYLSLDPYMRGRMSDEPSYALPVPVGGVMEGGTVCRVEQSNREDFEAGDLVLGQGGWQDFSLSNGVGLTRLDANAHKLSLALGVLGMPVQMGEWVRDGKIKFREDIVEGLENAPVAFIGMLDGKNFGKLVVHVSNG